MKLVRESLLEEFNKPKDTYSALGIGKRAQIEKWFKRYAPNAKYEIKDDLSVYVDDYGSLDLGSSDVTEIPFRLEVRESLYLRNAQIKELPEGLKVGEFLDLRNTQIKELPIGLKVGWNLYLSNTQIKELPEDLKVLGYIYTNNKDLIVPKHLKGKITYKN